MTFNSNIKITIIAEDILEVVIDHDDADIKSSQLNWYLADHLLKNQNDIEAVASEEMIFILSKTNPIDPKKNEVGVFSF